MLLPSSTTTDGKIEDTLLPSKLILTHPASAADSSPAT